MVDGILAAHEHIGRGILELQIAAQLDPESAIAQEVAAMQPEIEALGNKLFKLVEKAKAIPTGFDANDL